MRPIYLDYNATTPVDPAVADAMLPWLREQFGNPSSSHAFGQSAHAAVQQARNQVAKLIGAAADEIVFTSCATESTNQAIQGAVLAKLHGFFGRWARDAHVVTSAVEHPATLETCRFLERLGARLTVVPVDRQGQVDADTVRQAIERKTTLVSIMHSNNEVGTLQPIREIGQTCRERGVLFHVDAAQSVGKLPVNVADLNVDLLTIAGHKVYAPKGVGALYIRQGVKLEPLIHGAGQEGGRRSGTENVPHMVGLGKACELAQQSLPSATEHLRGLRNRLWDRLQAGLADRIVLNGHPHERLPNTLNVSFLVHTGGELLAAIPQIAASTGSACHAGRVTLSPVLQAMGVSPDVGRGAVRLSVGRFTMEEEIDRAAEAILQAARKTPHHAR